MEGKSLYLSATIAALALASTQVSAIGSDESTQRSLLDVAEEVCATEFIALFDYDEALSELLSNELGQRYPNVSDQQHKAFDKYVLGSVVNAIQQADISGYMGALTSGSPIPDAARSKSIALLDVVECLRITPSDKAALSGFVSVSVEAGNLPQHVDVDDLLSVQRMADCMHMIEAGRRMLALDASGIAVADDVQHIIEDTTSRCEETF